MRSEFKKIDNYFKIIDYQECGLFKEENLVGLGHVRKVAQALFQLRRIQNELVHNLRPRLVQRLVPYGRFKATKEQRTRICLELFNAAIVNLFFKKQN